jgi:hypothetical protein
MHSPTVISKSLPAAVRKEMVNRLISVGERIALGHAVHELKHLGHYRSQPRCHLSRFIHPVFGNIIDDLVQFAREAIGRAQ